MVLDIKTNNFVAVVQEKEWLDQSFSKAIDDASLNLVKSDGSDGFAVDKEGAVDGFYKSMYSTLNIVDNPDMQATIQNYTPVIAVTSNEGYYIFYSDEYRGLDGKTYYSKRWSEMLPYYYEDSDFIYSFTLTDVITIYDKNKLLDTSGELQFFTLNFYDFATDTQFINFRSKRPNSFLLHEDSYNAVKKTAIITNLEKTLTFYCNRHNNIARHFGIIYGFSMPIIDNSEWNKSIDDPSIVIIFQGYPYGVGFNNTYNRFNIAGSYVKKNEIFYLEQKSWYYLYHRPNCSQLENGFTFISEPYYTKYECIEKGAYACPLCNDTGVYPPEYNINGEDILTYSISNWDSTKLNNIWGVNNIFLYTENGILKGNGTGIDPYFSIRYTSLNTSYVDRIMVYARIKGSSTPISQLFFSTEHENYTEEKSVRSNVVTNGEWQWIEFKVSDNSNWRGDITNFRFDIIGDTSNSGNIEIQEIKFVGK